MKDKNLGERVRELRLSKGMSQTELAKLCGYSSKSVISKIEGGNLGFPLDKIAPMSKALGVSVDFLLYGKTAEPDPTFEGRKAVLLEYIRQMDEKQTERFIRFLEIFLDQEG